MVHLRAMVASFLAGICGACLYTYIISGVGVHAQSEPPIQDVVKTHSVQVFDKDGNLVGTLSAEDGFGATLRLNKQGRQIKTNVYVAPTGIRIDDGENVFSVDLQIAPKIEIAGENGNKNALLTPNGLTLDNVKDKKSEFLSLERIARIK